MKKEIRIFSIIIFSLIVFIGFSCIASYKFLNNEITDFIKEQTERYGYAAVFILTFLLELSPQPFVGGVVPAITGVALGLDFSLLLNWVFLAVILSNLAGYMIGFTYGKRVVLKFFELEYFEKYEDLFRKYGNLAMSIAALTPVPYFPAIAGTFKMRFSNFLFYAIFFRILHFLMFSWFFDMAF